MVKNCNLEIDEAVLNIMRKCRVAAEQQLQPQPVRRNVLDVRTHARAVGPVAQPDATGGPLSTYWLMPGERREQHASLRGSIPLPQIPVPVPSHRRKSEKGRNVTDKEKKPLEKHRVLSLWYGTDQGLKSEERSVPVAVRVHRTLELHDDKFYVITCGKAGFRNSRNETSHVSLKLVDKGRRVSEVVYSHPYTLRADVTRPDGTHGIRVKNCFAFNKLNSSVNLIDERGCPLKSSVISPFKYDPSTSSAEAELRSMFRFPDSSQLHFQCDIALCRGPCPEPSCADDDFQLQQAGLGLGSGLTAQSRALDQDALQAEEGALMASTSVFVLEPGEAPLVAELCDGGVHPPWLLWLCIALGVLFAIMLIINCFLCTAMTCSCARTEVIEKEPSIIEDYDPYRSWHGSQYGSRYSLNGKPGYTSGGSTMNSTRSVSTNSDHYAIVHSRPGSRYSHKNHRDRERDRDGRDHRDRGPPSHIGSHYSGKM
ncbi:Cuticlin-6 [Frankliniella fusca]|uniref:Cuticlin-6 n=1 Tax=Frankliniella fusca TaxID=407009 RepID=A0AAE1L7B3_9NEOP|nr:Cuticlin-6 [Frankliniella fusca]